MREEIKKRNVERERYLAAIVITIFIFMIGLILGISMDMEKTKYANYIMEKQDVNFESLQLQYLYLQTLQNKGTKDVCPVIQKVLENNLKVLQPVLLKLMEYEKNKDGNSPEYQLLKRKYIIYNIKYYLLSEKSRKLCNNDVVNVLYFYSDNCSICPSEGYILSHLRKAMKGRLLVFPFDVSYKKEPMIGILVARYNITRYPTIIVEGKKLQGFQTQNQLLKVICQYFNKKPDICLQNSTSW